MKTLKKLFAVTLVCLFVLSAVQIAVSAQDDPSATAETVDVGADFAAEDAAPAVDVVLAEDAQAIESGTVHAASIGTTIGTAIGSIIFSPFLLIDFIIWVFTGVHIFYSHLFG